MVLVRLLIGTGGMLGDELLFLVAYGHVLLNLHLGPSVQLKLQKRR